MEPSAIEHTEFDITQYILKILCSNLKTIWSWGFENPIRLRNGIKFSVSGFIFVGNIEIIYNEGTDLFDISFYNSNGLLQKRLDDIYVDQLVDVIDENVERVPDYENKVDIFYNL